MHLAGSERDAEALKPKNRNFKCADVNLDLHLMKILDLAFLRDDFFQS
jgi:hypothetical protein